MRTVFVVNQAGHDISAAEKFGKLVILTEGKVNVFGTDRLASDLKNKLKDAQQDDYMLLAGYSLINLFVGLILYEKFKKINLLIYNFTSKEYVIREVTSEYFQSE